MVSLFYVQYSISEQTFQERAALSGVNNFRLQLGEGWCGVLQLRGISPKSWELSLKAFPLWMQDARGNSRTCLSEIRTKDMIADHAAIPEIHGSPFTHSYIQLFEHDDRITAIRHRLPT